MTDFVSKDNFNKENYATVRIKYFYGHYYKKLLMYARY